MIDRRDYADRSAIAADPLQYDDGLMPRETICIVVDEPSAVDAGEKWLAANRDKLEFVSDDYGCGCCVHLYDVEGPADVLATLPDSIRGCSDWTLGHAKYGRSTVARSNP